MAVPAALAVTATNAPTASARSLVGSVTLATGSIAGGPEEILLVNWRGHIRHVKLTNEGRVQTGDFSPFIGFFPEFLPD